MEPSKLHRREWSTSPRAAGRHKNGTVDTSQYPYGEEGDFVPYESSHHAENEMRKRAIGFYELMARRRSVRTFSSADVPLDLIETAVRWAREAGASRGAVWITEGNAAALELCAGQGFAATGDTEALREGSDRTVMKMVAQL